MNPQSLNSIFQSQKRNFSTNKFFDLSSRRKTLSLMKECLLRHEDQLAQAVYDDLKKNKAEFLTSEFYILLSEIDFTLKNLSTWMKPQKQAGALLNWPSKTFIYPTPKGVTLVIGTWNYPVLLSLHPVISSLAAGNTVMIKPSEMAPHTAQVMANILNQTFESELVFVAQGEVEVAKELLSFDFDHIFFTGSTSIGKLVMKAAADHLASVTLELGGKSPCIIDRTTDLQVSCKRIVWGKFLNCGQTCVAPDYVLVHQSIKDEVVKALIKGIKDIYGESIQNNSLYSRIINHRQWLRLKGYLSFGQVAFGADFDEKNLYFSPTILTDVQMDSPLMQEEIFGPLLPVIDFYDTEDLIHKISLNPHPLALYLFSNDQHFINTILERVHSGGVCINDTIVQLLGHHTPFGGIKSSGIGHYHGNFGFKAFTHFRTVVKRSITFESSLKYPPVPEKLLKILKHFYKWIF